ncbi:MAG: hypothetical protein KDA28_10890, partial [Phycisphaerales bacterium]|nr:hypothetical protein [Phycisphaerales bacterium]
MDDTPRFETDCRDAVQNLRGALLDLYVAVGADPSRPQDVARRFRLNKNLTWKIAKIIQAEDALQAAPLVPGASGMDILISAMAEAAPNDDLVRQTRAALDRFERVIELHCGDRATLEMALDGGDTRQLEKSRKLAFRGNCGLWGLQATARVTAQFIAPNDTNPDLLDAGQLTGLEQVGVGVVGRIEQVGVGKSV